MKKKAVSMICTAMAAVSMLAVTACGSGTADSGAGTANVVDTKESKQEDSAGEDQEGSGDLLEAIQQRGELIVAMEGTWAPWTYHDEEDNLVGYDVEVAKAIARELGVEATFVEGEWDGLFAGMDSGRYDLVINGVEPTEERREKYDFSEPYGYIRTALVVRSDNDEIKGFEDLEGKSTANSIASTYMILAEEYGATATGVDTLDQTLDMVLSGRADATLNAEVSFYDYFKIHPEAELKVAALTDEASPVLIPMRKGPQTERLRSAVNEAIAAIRESGELSAISEKYFGSDISGAETGN
ncbi:MAG: transporter substrate-binding domain-containing protein [Lachnospiraceae bacterium]|nr:transporter substrate-binding domain-containing protein [Lachnospiraceae bacterium]